ncbi:MAG: hypothetical protein K6L80_08165 [Agarilytica sp.]
MAFKPYHYEYIDSVLRYYAPSMNREDIVSLLNNGISDQQGAKLFCDFIPSLLDQRLADEQSGKTVPVENGSAIIPDLHYEAGSFVCDAGFESIWDEMIEAL